MSFFILIRGIRNEEIQGVVFYYYNNITVSSGLGYSNNLEGFARYNYITNNDYPWHGGLVLDWKVEIVHWVDPHSLDPWTDIDEINLKPCDIHSVGYVLKENKESLVLSLNVNDENKDASCIMIIPKVCIKSRRVIDVEPRKKKSAGSRVSTRGR